MNMWEYLGIEKTKDLSSIKSSYARLLRSHHPEEGNVNTISDRFLSNSCLKAEIPAFEPL